MCGIAGFIGPPDHELLTSMCERIEHRGPDDEGYLEKGMASLGHRRLAIIDLQHGHEPMSSPGNDVHLVYNGEVYNFRQLRRELEAAGRHFATACDAEVVLAAYEAWGLECFQRFNGMWALAILDERPADPVVVLSRDHLGIKPLYFAQAGDRYLFASEIKALLASPDLVPVVDTDRLAEYLARGLHDHDERTFFAGIRQVLPATAVTIPGRPPARAGRSDPNGGGEPRVHRYWDPRLSVTGSGDAKEFRAAFTAAVERRLVADVTVGTCLSGGLDSSAIVCVMSSLLAEGAPDAASMGERLRTFSAVFDGDPIDEQEYIATVLEASGAESDFVRPMSAELFADLPLVVWHQDEPMVSSGPYAQYRVMQLAKGKSKVLLDGQGGDELLAGYVPYQYVYLRQLAKERRVAALARETAAARDVLTPLVRRKAADRRRAVDPAKLCPGLLADPARARAVRAADKRVSDDLKTRLLQDLTTYSLPSLLRYEDRNSMAHSIESRPPFLDQELVELVLALPPDAIVRDGWSRHILRQSLAGVLPEKVRLRRKKIGFTTPEMRWLRAERTRVQGIFRSPSFCSRPYWEAPAIARGFFEVCDGRLEESALFWRVLNAEAWLRVFHGRAPLSPSGRRPVDDLESAGDAEAIELVGAPAERWRGVQANAGKHVFSCGPDGKVVFGRAPVRTPRIESGDDLGLIVTEAVLAVADGQLGLEAGDIVAISEKAVAVAQGRSFPASEVRAGPLARLLCRLVRKGPRGIGLGIPATMQLAIDEAGAARILLATAAGAAARLAGRTGTFYRVAGHRISAIDGPTGGTLPPSDTHAKLPPSDPDGVAARLAGRLSEKATGPVEVAVVDANDRGVAVLGATTGVDREALCWLFGDNPLGQGVEQTPVALVRRLGRLGEPRPASVPQ
jgi:asparagine synthase (glutamine-hydrolysing)